MFRLFLIVFVLFIAGCFVLFIAGCSDTFQSMRENNLPKGATNFTYVGGNSWYTWDWEGRKYMTYYPGDSFQPSAIVEIK